MAISNRSDGSGGVIGPDMDGTADLARLMVEANPLPMWVCECRTGAILSFNPAFRALFKVDRGEDLILSERLLVVGAEYDLRTGVVDFFEG